MLGSRSRGSIGPLTQDLVDQLRDQPVAIRPADGDVLSRQHLIDGLAYVLLQVRLITAGAV